MTDYLELADDILTAEDPVRIGGFSYTTARKYLEYFVVKGVLAADISYSSVGRPARVYRKASQCS